jgi:hypothetical protein
MAAADCNDIIAARRKEVIAAKGDLPMKKEVVVVMTGWQVLYQ